MKTCKKCNQEFPSWIRVNGVRKNLQSRSYCLNCSGFGKGNRERFGSRLTAEERIKKRKQQKYAHQQKMRRERKEKLLTERGGKCERCGYSKCLAALEFHHKDPKKKKFGLGSHGWTRSWKSLVEEAKKCDVLCSNCHKELHYEQGLARRNSGPTHSSKSKVLW